MQSQNNRYLVFSRVLEPFSSHMPMLMIAILLTLWRCPDLSLLARQSLRPIELAIWQSLPSDQQSIAYYRTWIVKKAFAKARGGRFTDSA